MPWRKIASSTFYANNVKCIFFATSCSTLTITLKHAVESYYITLYTEDTLE